MKHFTSFYTTALLVGGVFKSFLSPEPDGSYILLSVPFESYAEDSLKTAMETLEGLNSPADKDLSYAIVKVTTEKEIDVVSATRGAEEKPPPEPAKAERPSGNLPTPTPEPEPAPEQEPEKELTEEEKLEEQKAEFSLIYMKYGHNPEFFKFLVDKNTTPEVNIAEEPAKEPTPTPEPAPEPAKEEPNPLI